MKKAILVFLCSSVVIAACNSGGSSSKSADSVTTATPATPEATTPSEKGLELIGASDCTTCHRLHKESAGANIGPAYSEVAAKYSPAA
ncbi:MAG TPA: c-type cytochrome, partial [Puia sp.]